MYYSFQSINELFCNLIRPLLPDTDLPTNRNQIKIINRIDVIYRYRTYQNSIEFHLPNENIAFLYVEDKRLELLTPCVQGRCSTN